MSGTQARSWTLVAAGNWYVHRNLLFTKEMIIYIVLPCRIGGRDAQNWRTPQAGACLVGPVPIFFLSDTGT